MVTATRRFDPLSLLGRLCAVAVVISAALIGWSFVAAEKLEVQLFGQWRVVHFLRGVAYVQSPSRPAYEIAVDLTHTPAEDATWVIFGDHSLPRGVLGFSQTQRRGFTFIGIPLWPLPAAAAVMSWWCWRRTRERPPKPAKDDAIRTTR